ncbi:unnamed protein product [Allacma fusca]|uniref:N-acetyltransferase domain-containing protein n=1 Tax=Allacma fusca TaxID=39272 RepID=A0A8J2JS37_9HEXA|nr:unnamed protein product [Allacma fusca]
MALEVVCLSDHLDLLGQCVDLLNEQWPRSKSARLRSLEQSKSDSFPTSLLLVQKSANNEATVIGHSKILPVPYRMDSCFVESVVISPRLRGQGLGRLIMDGTEEFVKKKGIKTVHLTTHDQQGFYSKLGYVNSEPVVVYGGISPSLQKLIENNDRGWDHQKLPEQNADLSKAVSKVSCEIRPLATEKVPLPPPPPPSPAIVKLDDNTIRKTYMNIGK